jgi:hypothetical protein
VLLACICRGARNDLGHVLLVAADPRATLRVVDTAAIAQARLRAQGIVNPTATTPEAALKRLVAVQAQEHPVARWSLAQRTRRPDAAAVDRAFDAGRILRTHVLRPTWHFVSPADLGWLMSLSGPEVDRRNARRYQELGLTPRTLARTDELIAGAVEDGALTREEIGEVLRRKRIDPAGQRLPHILMHAELSSTICSGPKRAKAHTYAAFDSRVTPRPALDREEALQRLAERYVATRGPVTRKDFAWWSGLPAADVRRAFDLARRSLQARLTDGRSYVMADRSAHRTMSAPRIDLVQCYDEAIISYTQSRDVLHGARASFPVPRAIDGFSHVVLLDGHLLGHWRLRDGAVETRISAPLSRQERAALHDAVERCDAFFFAERGR